MKYLILLAGGVGSRSGLSIPKQFLKVNGEILINHLIKRIESSFDQIVIVLNDHPISNEIIKSSKIKIVKPGKERIFSIINGLNSIEYKPTDHIYIHDAARVLLSKEDIASHEKCLCSSKAVISVAPSVDTMFVINKDVITKVYKKSAIVRGLTPQSYKGEVLNKEILSRIKNEADLTEIFSDIEFNTVNQTSNLRKVTSPEDVKWIKGAL